MIYLLFVCLVQVIIYKKKREKKKKKGWKNELFYLQIYLYNDCKSIGAAPLGKEHIDALVERIPSTVRQGYGMTETTSGCIIQHSKYMDSGSIGILLPNCEAKIVDENDNGNK